MTYHGDTPRGFASDAAAAPPTISNLCDICEVKEWDVICDVCYKVVCFGHLSVDGDDEHPNICVECAK